MSPTYQISGSITSLLAWRVSGNPTQFRSGAIGSESYNEVKPILSVEEYRTLLNDRQSTEDKIVMRLEFLEAYCRGIIRQVLKPYGED